MPTTAGQRELQEAAAPRLEALNTVLGTDRVIPLTRALSMTGLSPRALSREFHVSEILVEPRAYTSPAVRTGVISQETLNLKPVDVRHLLGIAAMRRDLGVQPEDWKVYAHFDQVHRRGWTTSSGIVAVEFDVGYYTSRTVQTKARLFQAAYNVE